MTKALRSTVGLILAAGLVLVTASVASAHHANEAITVTPFSGLSDGMTLQVSISGFTPNAKPVKLVVAGQGELTTIPDKLNFEEYANAPEVPLAADGSGSAEFIVTSDHGTMQDGTTLDCTVDQCWLIAVQEPFLPQPNYASQEIFFGDNAPPTSAAPAPAPTEAPTTTAAPETTTTEAPTTTSTTEKKVAVVIASKDAEDDSSSPALLIGIIAAVVIIGGAAAYFLTKKKPVDDGTVAADDAAPTGGTDTTPPPTDGPAAG